MGTAGKDKFKVGDRVRFTNKCPHGWWFGPNTQYKEGKITEIACSRFRYEVDCLGNHYAYVDDEHIELIFTTPSIVAVIENDTPKPNARPRIHDTEASATTEAERLAKLNPGHTFGVFVQTTARVADVTVRVV